MHSPPLSPVAPVLFPSSTIRHICPAKGQRIGTTPFKYSFSCLPGSQCKGVMAIVASVGPYRFPSVELTAARCQSDAYVAGTGTPQKRTDGKLGVRPGVE